jgi:hypothetical protein
MAKPQPGTPTRLSQTATDGKRWRRFSPSRSHPVGHWLESGKFYFERCRGYDERPTSGDATVPSSNELRIAPLFMRFRFDSRGLGSDDESGDALVDDSEVEF